MYKRVLFSCTAYICLFALLIFLFCIRIFYYVNDDEMLQLIRSLLCLYRHNHENENFNSSSKLLSDMWCNAIYRILFIRLDCLEKKKRKKSTLRYINSIKVENWRLLLHKYHKDHLSKVSANWRHLKIWIYQVKMGDHIHC